MSKENTVKGAGFVKENRVANNDEQKAVNKALAEFGEKQCLCLGDGAYLYGRYDAPYGWYVFGLPATEADEKGRKYLILGDCLDVLPDYRKLLTLADVVRFAWDQDADGAYDAIQEWGVFSSITYKMSSMLNEHDICVEGECVVWNGKEWKLRWDILFNTESGKQELVQILIPACLGSREEADDAFASEWKGYTESYSAEVFATAECEADEDIDFSEAMMTLAEEKRDEIVRINKLLQGFVKFGLAEIEDEPKIDKDMVWVLIIRWDGENCPEVHKTFEGAIDGAKEDYYSWEEATDEQWEKIKKELEIHHYYDDGVVVYDLNECYVCV